LLGAVVIAEPGWAQSSADQQNERQIAANRTATAAARATFEAQNAGAIARHGAAEPTQTPGPTWTPTPTSTPVPLPAPTDVPPTDLPAPTDVPCAMQYSWTLLLDDQGDAITQLDDSGQVVGLWQDADGDQMWAPSTYFCPDSADTPTPIIEPTDTSTATAVVLIPSATPTPAPTVSTASPVSRPFAAAPAYVQVVERTVVVVATPTDTDPPTDEPAPTDTPPPTSALTRVPTPTPTVTRSPTSTRSPTPTWTAIPTWTPYAQTSTTPTVAPVAAAASDDQPAAPAPYGGPSLRDPIVFSLIVGLLVLSAVLGPRMWRWAERMSSLGRGANSGQ
jgi:hypothetical protein